jgi:hypothetical protein
MKRKTIFQTLDNKENPDEIESQGPFLCTRKPWLGNGYYFWDTFVELAHWWGRQGYNGNYVICQSQIDYNPEDVFDLVGDTEQISEFRNYAKILKECYKGKFLTVGFVIEHMKQKMKNFTYSVIRANPIDSVKHDPELKALRLPFVSHNSAFLDMIPPIQLCIINKRYIGENNFKIIYPMEYCKESVV